MTTPTLRPFPELAPNAPVMQTIDTLTKQLEQLRTTCEAPHYAREFPFLMALMALFEKLLPMLLPLFMNPEPTPPTV